MKESCTYWLLSLFFIPFVFLSCSNDPITSDLEHSSLSLDTLAINSLDFQNYLVYPNNGSNSKLYLGKKNNIESTAIFISMETPSPVNYWAILKDTNVIVDSIRLEINSEDSTLSSEGVPNLYFSPDSHFSENNSTYLDFENLSFSSWESLGTPLIKMNLNDSSNFVSTKLVWSIDTLKDALYDTLDTNLVRTFSLQFSASDSNFIELLSEEAGYQTTDPKVLIYYRFETSSEDTTVYDTTFRTIYSASDLSILKPDQNIIPSNKIGLSNGLGLRVKMFAQIPIDSFPSGCVIKSANLFIPIDSSMSDSNYRIIIDPIESDSQYVDSSMIYLEDPYSSYGSPYRISNFTTDNSYIISIKPYVQNVLLENVNSIGFKIIADEDNNPFKSSWFDLARLNNKPVIEIVYVKP